MKTGLVQFVGSRHFVILAAILMSQSATAANINDAFLAMEVPDGTEASSFPGPNGGTITLGYNLTPTDPNSFVSTGLVHSNAYNGWSSIEGFAAPSALPALHVNTLGAPNSVTGLITVATDQIYMHAGNPAGDPVIAPFSAAVLRYTVLITGTYDITGSFDSIDTGIAAVDILRNGTSILSSGAGSDATPFSELGVLLSAGDFLDFVVGDSNGNVFSDSTGLYANVVLRGDTDGDGVFDELDNCVIVANPPTDGADCDTDKDGYGNRCDGDFDQDYFVFTSDFTVWDCDFGPLNPTIPPRPQCADGTGGSMDGGTGTDMDCDGFVFPPDFLIWDRYYQDGDCPKPGEPPEDCNRPGPSGLSCAGMPGCE